MPSLIPSSEDVRVYEWCILYPYPIGQKEESDLLKEIDGYFAEVGAKLILRDKWGRRGLAYPVGGFTEGNFVVYYFEMDPSKVKEVDTQLKISKGILRHLFVKPPKHYQVIKYSEAYDTWLKERENVDEKRARENEQKVQDAVARKAKRQVKLSDEKKKEEVKAAPALSKEALTEKLDKLISDDTL